MSFASCKCGHGGEHILELAARHSCSATARARGLQLPPAAPATTPSATDADRHSSLAFADAAVPRLLRFGAWQ